MKIVGKVIKSYRYYTLKTEGLKLYCDARGTPEYYVKKESDNDYTVIKFNKKWFTTNKFKIQLINDLIYTLDSKRLSPRINIDFRDGIDWKKDMSRSELASLLTEKVGVPFVTFEKEFGELFLDDGGNGGGIKELKFKNWRIILKDGLYDNSETIELLEEVERYCRRFKKLCYGIVEVKKSMPANVLADYSVNTDALRVKYKRASNEFVLTFLHELGHRYWYKFADNEQKREVRQKYFELMGKGRPFFKAGDVIELNSSMVIKVVADNKPSVRAEILATPPRVRKLKEGMLVTFPTLPREYVRTINGEEIQNEGLPSAYSRKSVEEFFAEVFSFYLTGKLSKEIKSWFDSIL